MTQDSSSDLSGRYELQECVEEGSTTRLYKGTDKTTGEKVTIRVKTMPTKNETTWRAIAIIALIAVVILLIMVVGIATKRPTEDGSNAAGKTPPDARPNAQGFGSRQGTGPGSSRGVSGKSQTMGRAPSQFSAPPADPRAATLYLKQAEAFASQGKAQEELEAYP